VYGAGGFSAELRSVEVLLESVVVFGGGEASFATRRFREDDFLAEQQPFPILK
jgi:hypothetical protein